jgi:two-component system nitrogen regulation response regulator GlnG
MAQVLLIDDDPDLIAEQIRHAFPPPGHRLDIARDGASGLDIVRRQSPDVVLLDLRLPDQSGLEVYGRLRAMDAQIPVIFITLAKTAETAIEAIKSGAFDYLHKPVDLLQLRRVVGDALEIARLASPVVIGDDGDAEVNSEGALFGGCPAMFAVYKAIGRVAPQDVTVLLTGESGTGKELVARAIHQHSARSSAPFLAINCAAIPDNLLESELFGHERGAFTGADRRRIGKFEQARGGTILLDEIGDMPISLQPKILRLLQERCFERVGGGETIPADVRIIASTHRDLLSLAAATQFRQDLYYRLSGFSIHLPPLRARGEDIVMLVRHYMRRYALELGREVREIAPEALERLRSHAWPGNVRELQNVLKHALLQASGSVLLPTFLPPLGQKDNALDEAIGESRSVEAFIREQFVIAPGEVWSETYRKIDRLLFSVALESTKGNRRDAAQLLGISRETMRARLRALGLRLNQTVEAVEVGEAVEEG